MQRLVDVDGLLCLHTSGSSERLLLRTSQIDKLKLAHCHIHWIMHVLRFNCNRKDGVGSTTEVVKIMTGQDAIPSSISVQIEDFLSIGRFEDVQILYYELVLLGPSDAETLLAVQGAWGLGLPAGGTAT